MCPARSLIIWRQNAQNVIPGDLKAVIFSGIQHLRTQIREARNQSFSMLFSTCVPNFRESRKKSFSMAFSVCVRRLQEGNVEGNHFLCCSAFESRIREISKSPFSRATDGTDPSP
jgi:hypothetical protein